MKKIIFILMVVMAFVIMPKEVKAFESENYNLIDLDLIDYNEETKAFYSTQKIPLSKGQTYTLIASSKFFGTVTKDNPEALYNKEMGASFVNENNDSMALEIILTVDRTGLHYGSFVPTENVYLEITDFLTRGYTLETLPKKEIVLIKGKKDKFVGFKANEFLDNYAKIHDSLNIYTDYQNPIKTDDITQKIRVYDNEMGFYDEFTLIEDNYQNSTEIGVYTLIYSAKDNYDNEGILTVKIYVVDDTPPVIIGPDVIEWDCYSPAPKIEDILRQYTANDGLNGDLSFSIRALDTGLLSYQQGKIAEYEVILQVSDAAGNVGRKTVIISAKDITNPYLTLKDLEVNLSELGKIAFSGLFSKTIAEVGDNSGKYTVKIDAMEVINNMGFSGAYTLCVTVSDEAGNEIQKTATITFIDDLAPEFYMQMDLLETTTDEIYTLSELKDVISNKLYQDGILCDEISLISCDYLSNEKTPGTYNVKYAYTYKGETNYMVGTITVKEPPQRSYYWCLAFLAIPVLFIGYKINKKRKTL